MNFSKFVRTGMMSHMQVLLFVSICSVGALAQANPPPDPHPYFPPAAFETALLRGDTSRAVWYGCALAALAEPSLFETRNDTSALETYRFLWLRTFHRPVSVRLTIISEGNGVVVTKISDGQGGYKPGKLVTNRISEVSRVQVQDLLERLQRVDFWSMPTEPTQANATTRDPSSGGNVVALPPVDGAQWIVEGRKNGNYHVVDRWSPGNDTYAQLCKVLLQLGGVKEKDVY